MPTVFKLTLETGREHMSQGPVRAVPAKLIGYWRDAEKDIVVPDMAAVRECARDKRAGIAVNEWLAFYGVE